jgi:hypothetical protein
LTFLSRGSDGLQFFPERTAKLRTALRDREVLRLKEEDAEEISQTPLQKMIAYSANTAPACPTVDRASIRRLRA